MSIYPYSDTDGSNFRGYGGGMVPPGATQPKSTAEPAPTQRQQPNFVERLGGFARDIYPLLYQAGSLIESIKGVPRFERRFAGFNNALEADVMARSLGYGSFRELAESRQRQVAQQTTPEPQVSGEALIPKEANLGELRGEGASENERMLGLSAAIRGSNKYDMSLKDFVRLAGDRGYEFGPKALSAAQGLDPLPPVSAKARNQRTSAESTFGPPAGVDPRTMPVRTEIY